jgi:hypothetical protein
MRVALCFWGICRSTSWTIDSIKSCIFQPLEAAGIQFDVYIHTYLVYRPYTNPRAEEFSLQLRNTDWKLLGAREGNHMTENQDRVDLDLQLAKYRSQGNPWPEDGGGFITLDNHIRALWSLKQVTNLWKTSEIQYDAIMYLRPDVQYLRPLAVDWVRGIPQHTVCMPNFHLHTGCNDRFAIGSPSVMEIYGNRFQGALAYSQYTKLHSEQYLAYTLQNANIRIEYIPFRFKRVRANGEICEADKLL